MRRVVFRVPLHVKAMFSYLLVVGLVVVPMFLYMRTIQRGELRDTLVRDVREELEIFSEHLAESPDARLQEDVAQMLRLSGRRLTIIDPSGRVLGDSQVTRELDNHADRPEVRQALESADGFGSSSRPSKTLGTDLLYCAIRFPRTGPPRGVIRLAVPVASLDATEQRASVFLSRASGLALTGAVFLSLIAAIVVSRPLRRVVDRAHAFAAGDFGSPVREWSNDELGDVARALDDLATRVRDQLVTLGADRGTLRAVIDELPVGVILYGEDGVVISASARVLCRLDPAKEDDQARRLLERADQAAVVAQVLADGITRSAPLELPWAPDAKRTARWVATFSAGGQRKPALLVIDAAVAERAERETAPPRPEDVEVVALEALFSAAIGCVTETGVAPRIECALPDPGVMLAEANGRVGAAVGHLLKEALASHDGAPLHVRAEVTDRTVRLVLDGAVGEQTLGAPARTLRYFGGDAGTQDEGDATATWLSIARA